MSDKCQKKTFLVGLTGGIGSGKSAASDVFASLGMYVIDTDVISRRLTSEPGAALDAIRESFGEQFLLANGALDRDAMRTHVFHNPSERLKLQALLHPMIYLKTLDEIETAESLKKCFVLLVVPLLFESMRFRSLINYSISIDCAEDVQIVRVRSRSGLDESTVRQILSSQVPRSIRLQLSDVVVSNDGRISELHERITETYHQLLKLCA